MFISINQVEINYQWLGSLWNILSPLKFSLFHVTFGAEAFSVVLLRGMKAVGGKSFVFSYLFYKRRKVFLIFANLYFLIEILHGFAEFNFWHDKFLLNWLTVKFKHKICLRKCLGPLAGFVGNSLFFQVFLKKLLV